MAASVATSCDRLLSRMAELTGTDRADWFAVFKARHGMQVVLAAAGEATGRTEVLTQLFTCVTAVDPIIAAGLRPRYVDVSESSLAIDPALAHPDARTLAVVAQHTFGIVDEIETMALRDAAHKAGALLLEDSAHCVGRMARDEEGMPLADVSIHSFGVEKVLPGVYFGGAVWVSPRMGNPILRSSICTALSSLPELSTRTDRACRRYRNQMRVFTRVPHAVSVAMRESEARRGTFEPAVADEERRGAVRHEPCLPSAWVSDQATAALGGLGSNEAQRKSCVAAYLDVFGTNPATCPLPLPADVRTLAADQPLLRMPVFFETTELAERAIAATAALGHYAQAWPRPLLLPGVLDPTPYGLGEGTDAWPVSTRLSAGVVGLPTDIDPVAVPALAQRMLEIAREGH